MHLRSALLIFMLPVLGIAQRPSFKKLSCPEKRWVLLHPFAAKKAYHITVEVRAVSKEMEKDLRLDADADGGQVDAFRHGYWMARLSQVMCRRKANRLGIAHERGNYQDFKKQREGEELFSDSAGTAMDLANNQTGLDEGSKNKFLSRDEIKEIIVKKILDGEMKIILKDKNGNSLDCNGQVIDLKSHPRQWNIPRCVVESNSGRQ